MNAIKLIGRGGLAAVLSLSFAMIVLPNVSAADRLGGAGEVLIVSDEIHGHSLNVVRADGSAPNDGNQSGLGDGSNPGQGDGTGNAKNSGNNNPNQANKGPK